MSLLIYCDSIFENTNISTVNGLTINIKYSNYVFTITKHDNTVIRIFENIDESSFIDYTDEMPGKEFYSIPFYFNDIWVKTVYVLYLSGYIDFIIYNTRYMNPEPFYNNNVIPGSILSKKLLLLYYTKQFYNYISNFCDIRVIHDDGCLPICFQRINTDFTYKTIQKTLHDYLFNRDFTVEHETNANILLGYRCLLKYPIKTPEYILSTTYASANSHKIDYDFKDKITFNFVNEDDNLPINLEDYKFLYNFYNFNPNIYSLICTDVQGSDETCMFIHFLLKEQNKSLVNLPPNFNYDLYLELNSDLQLFTSPREVILHFINQGKKEQRNIYKLPLKFNWKLYVQLNGLTFTDKYEAENHFITYGRQYKLLSNDMLPISFDPQMYARRNIELANMTDVQLMKHYLENNLSNPTIIDSFIPSEYIDANPDLKYSLGSCENSKIIDHFVNNGIFENRHYKVQKVSTCKKILLLCHVGSIETFKKMEQYIEIAHNTNSAHLQVTIVINIVDSVQNIEYIRNKFPYAQIRINPDFGFDIGGFFLYLKKCKDEGLDFDYVIKIHTKTSDIEREKLIKPLLGSVERINYISDLFNDEKIGLVGSQECMYYNYDQIAIHNFNHLSYLINKFKLNISAKHVIQFVGGTMFWIRYSVLKKIFFDYNFDQINTELNNEYSFDWNWYVCANSEICTDLKNIKNKADAYAHYMKNHKTRNLSGNLFHSIKHGSKSSKLRDGMIEHAYERFFSYAIEDLNYTQIFLPIKSLINVYNIKPVPIIFPQFHQIPENDKFWGTGFTEWTMLNKCPENYLGETQLVPHVDIGQYNILEENYINWCNNTFQKYNIDTICYYHYWFNGHKVMYKPIEKIRDEGKPATNFYLAWANETWSSRWDGLDTQTLIKQDYGDQESWTKHILYLLTFFTVSYTHLTLPTTPYV